MITIPPAVSNRPEQSDGKEWILDSAWTHHMSNKLGNFFAFLTLKWMFTLEIMT